MQKASRRTPSQAATSSGSKNKRRRTSSSPPRTRLSTQGKSNGESTETLNATPKTNNRRRRSSVKRRSLIATLECIQPPSEENEAELGTGTGTKEREEDSEKLPKVTIIAEDVQIPKTGVSSSTEKTSPDSGLSVLANVEKEHSKIVQKLRMEVKSWEFQLEKSKRLQNVDLENKFSTSVVNFDEIDSKYRHWHEQISDLEDKLSEAFLTINTAMGRIETLKLRHTSRVHDLTEDLCYLNARRRHHEDAKLLIKTIFELYNKSSDG